MDDFKFKKKYGQNFLKDDRIVEKIVTLSDIEDDSLVIEVGPGKGILTRQLSKAAKNVICYEIDMQLEGYLINLSKELSNVEVVFSDFLDVDLAKKVSDYKYKHLYFISNVPYYITTPIIMKLLEEKLDIETITVMVQKEVADRLIAIPGEKLSGAITYSVYYYATSENVTIVENNSFIPEPEVDSEVIKLSIRKNPPVELLDEDQFFKTVKASFMQRRKTLINALVNGGILKSKQDAKKLFDDLNMNYNTRGESLSIEMFAEISNYIVNNKI